VTTQVQALIAAIRAVGDTIRDLGEVPSGHLYAMLMGHMSLETYNKLIGALQQSKLVKVENHLITWIGPKA